MLLSGQKRFDFSLDLCIDRGFRLLIDPDNVVGLR